MTIASTARMTGLCAASLAVLAACGEPEQAPAPAPEPTPAPVPVTGPQTLTEADMQQVTLSGELACSFSQEQGGMPLFIGRGDVVDTAGATGAVKIEDRVRSLQMEGTGGFSGLSDGATLSGDGATVVIDVTGQSPLPEDPQIAEESPRYTASMTVRLDDTSATVEGFYECGP
jgi:hypothetical protein